MRLFKYKKREKNQNLKRQFSSVHVMLQQCGRRCLSVTAETRKHIGNRYIRDSNDTFSALRGLLY